MPTASLPVSVRVGPAERDILEAAEIELRAHPIVTIPAADWERFEAWAQTPAKPVPALRELAARRPAWQD